MGSLKVHCALIFTLLFWASAFVGIRVGLTAYSPGALALLRFLVASFAMAIIYFYLPDKKKISWPDRLQLLLLGVAGIGIYNICLNYGELSVSAGVASFIIGLIPVVTIVLSVLFLHERPSPVVWVGILISFIGLLFLIIGEEDSSASMTSGALVILIATFMGAFYTVAQKRYLRNYHPVAVTAWIIWGGTFMLLIFSPQLWQEIKIARQQATFAAVYMGVFPAAFAYVGWSYVLHHWSAYKASMYLYALPLLSTFLGFILLHEESSFLSLSGGVISLVGALLATRLRASQPVLAQVEKLPKKLLK